MNSAADPIVVTADDFEFRDLPASVPAGTTLELVNASDVEVHELVAIRLPSDESRPVEELLELPPEELDSVFASLPATVLVARPASSATAAVGDGTLTEPGRYAIICFIPTGADPDQVMTVLEEFDPESDEEPEIDGGPPHIVHGMFAELTVE